MNTNVLVLDVGTTGVKALIFSSEEKVVKKFYKKLEKDVRPGGIVEQNPKEIIDSSISVIVQALAFAEQDGLEVIKIGMTNQRETTIIWDTRTGREVYPAIVWEDTRTKIICESFEKDEQESVSKLTGLHIDPYFSATKIKWILDQYEGDTSNLKFGTVDTWIMWNILEGAPHYTDITNASRTLLLDVRNRKWSESLLNLFGVPEHILPLVRPTAGLYGTLRHDMFTAPLQMQAVIGDQESSMFAAGDTRGATKVTYGTGTFIGQIIGGDFVVYPHFFTTPTADKNNFFMIEAKIDCCGNKAEPLVGDTEKLNVVINELTEEVVGYINKLPIRPEQIIVDGGLTQAPHTREALETATGIPVIAQSPYDGTALGVARMLIK